MDLFPALFGLGGEGDDLSLRLQGGADEFELSRQLAAADFVGLGGDHQRSQAGGHDPVMHLTVIRAGFMTDINEQEDLPEHLRGLQIPLDHAAPGRFGLRHLRYILELLL